MTAHVMDPVQAGGLPTSTVEEELRRFFLVAEEYTRTTGKPALMPSCIIDEYWHGLIEMTDGLITPLATELFGSGATIKHIESGGFGPID